MPISSDAFAENKNIRYADSVGNLVSRNSALQIEVIHSRFSIQDLLTMKI